VVTPRLLLSALVGQRERVSRYLTAFNWLCCGLVGLFLYKYLAPPARFFHGIMVAMLAGCSLYKY